MNNNFIHDYNTIVNGLESGQLVAYTPDNHFIAVGSAGRVWRAFTGFVWKENNFQDCDAATLGNKIVEFVRQNREEMTPERGERLLRDLVSLKGRLRKNYMNLDFNIRAISETLRIDFRSL